MRRLTDLEARTIRWMGTVSGAATVPDPAMVGAIHSMISDGLASVAVTVKGYQALADYDRLAADPSSKRIVSGMALAGLAALEQQEGRDA